jgi:RNA polymerase sigma-70 factor (ECF subfamily)
MHFPSLKFAPTYISATQRRNFSMLAAAQTGDQQAFMSMVSPFAPGMQRLANRYTRNVTDAEDICQESLLKAYTKLSQFSGETEFVSHEFHGWLTRIAANSAIDFIRRKHAKKLVALDECQLVPNLRHQAGPSGWGENPERTYVRKERRALLVRAIKNLPVELRRVCLLRSVMQFSTSEVATKLGISTTAVRLRLFRAHGHLRKSLGGEVFMDNVRARNNRMAKQAPRRHRRRNADNAHMWANGSVANRVALEAASRL